MSRRSLRVIVNADDLGWSQEITDAVFSLIEAGRLTSATVMANGPYFEETAERIRGVSGVSFGVHLNLTQGPPCGDGRHLGALLDAEGNLRKLPRRGLFSPSTLAGVYAEFDAQIRRVASHGVAISHLDSHHHVHTRPALFPVIKRLQMRHGIRRVRISQNIYAAGSAPMSKRLAKSFYNWSLAHIYRTKVPDGFTDFMIFYQAAKSGRMPYDLVEAMVHPGPASYQEETRLLWTDWWKDLPFDVRLTTWESL